MKEDEGATPVVEGIKGAEEQPKPTLLEEKPTRTEKEFQRAVSKGLESIQQQLDLHKAEADKAKAELKSKELDLKAFQEDLAELEKLHLDDPEVREAYVSKKALREAQRAVDKAKADVEGQRYDIEKIRWQMDMDKRANELVAETGIDINQFVGCVTKEEMEVKALRFKLENPPIEKEEKFISGGGVGGGGKGMPELAKDKIKAGWGEIHK